MAEGKIRPLIDQAKREAITMDAAERNALAQDLYSALEAQNVHLRAQITENIASMIVQVVQPLQKRIEALEREQADRSHG